VRIEVEPVRLPTGRSHSVAGAMELLRALPRNDGHRYICTGRWRTCASAALPRPTVVTRTTSSTQADLSRTESAQFLGVSASIALSSKMLLRHSAGKQPDTLVALRTTSSNANSAAAPMDVDNCAELVLDSRKCRGTVPSHPSIK